MDNEPTNAMSDNFTRLATFQHYPVAEAGDTNGASLLRYNSPLTLSKAGFYRYPEAPGDEVKCYQCSVRYRGWSGEPPLAVHRILSPNCPHVVSQTPARLTATRVGANRVRRRLQMGSPTSSNTSDDIPDAATSQRSVMELYNDYQNRGTSSGSDMEDEDAGSVMFESHRLLTFPSPTHPQAEEWAAAGFIHKGEGGAVRCVFCGLEMQYETEQPTNAHKQQSQNCPLVNYLETSVGNITRELENKVRSQYFELTNGNGCSGIDTGEPLFKHPQFEEEKDRMDTFKHWPTRQPLLSALVNLLSKAGFYYSGHIDKVVCFTCGCSLRNWDPTADPWTQHARHSPQCVYVRQEKGDNFITQAQDAEELTDCDPPSDCGSDPSSPSSPLRSSLDMAAIKAALACQYDVQQIRHAVLKFFLSSRGYYPNDTLLLGTLRAMDVNFSQLQRQKEQLHNKDVNIIKQAEHIEKVHQQLERKDEALEENQTYLEREQAERERREREVRVLRVRLNQRDNVVHSQASVIQRHSQQLQNQSHQLENKDSELERKQREMDRQAEENRRQAEENRRQAEEMRRQAEENRRQAEQMEKLRQLLLANNINFDNVAEQDNDVAAGAPVPIVPSDPSSSYTRCKICLEEDARCVFRPCRHMCCGTHCAPRFIGDKCPICRDRVRDWEIIYVA